MKIALLLHVALFNYSLCCGQVEGVGKKLVVDGTSNESFRNSLLAIKASLSDENRKSLNDALEFICERDIKEHDAVKAIRRQLEAVTKGENVAIDSLMELRSGFHGKTAAEIIKYADSIVNGEWLEVHTLFNKTMDETIHGLKNDKKIKAWEKQLLNSVRILQPGLTRKEGQKYNEVEFYVENSSEFTISKLTVKARYVDLKRGEQLSTDKLFDCEPANQFANIEPHKRAMVRKIGTDLKLSSEKATNIWNTDLRPDAALFIIVLEIKDENSDTIAGSTYSEDERREDLEIATMQRYMSRLFSFRYWVKPIRERSHLVRETFNEVSLSEHLFREALHGDSSGLLAKFKPMMSQENFRDFETLIKMHQDGWRFRKTNQEREWKRLAQEQFKSTR